MYTHSKVLALGSPSVVFATISAGLVVAGDLMRHEDASEIILLALD